MEKINPNYSDTVLEGFNKLREQNQLCDVIINAGERTFNAHKAVLAATSSYFAAMFTSGFKESSENEIKIDSNSQAMETLLQFAYTGRFDGSQIMDGLFDVLELSCYTESTEFSITCSEFIVNLLESEQLPEEISLVDICKMAFLARNHDHLSELVKASDMHLENNLQRLKFSDVFLQNASAQFLQEFLGRDGLFCTMDEKQVLELAISWLKHSWEDRCNHSLQLLQKVRLGLIPSEDLKELIGPEVLEIPGCSELVNDVLKLQTSETSKSDLALEKPEFFETRGMTKVSKSDQADRFMDEEVSKLERKIIPPDTSFEKLHRNFQFINSQDDKYYCINLPKITQDYPRLLDIHQGDDYPVARYSIVGVGKRVYVAGGTSNLYDSMGGVFQSNRDFFCYEPAIEKWVQLPSMATERHSAAMVYLDGYIYVFGGIQNRTEIGMKTMERYDVIKKKWESLKPLLPEQIDRRNTCTSAIVFKRKIIASLQEEDCLMVYYPAKDEWKLQHKAKTERYHSRESMLFKHHGHYYKILYTPDDYGAGEGYNFDYNLPSVYELEIKTESDGTVNISIGQKLHQNDLPICAFRIKKEVFMIKCGLAYKVNINVRPAQSQVVQSQQSGMLLNAYLEENELER